MDKVQAKHQRTALTVIQQNLPHLVSRSAGLLTSPDSLSWTVTTHNKLDTRSSIVAICIGAANLDLFAGTAFEVVVSRFCCQRLLLVKRIVLYATYLYFLERALFARLPGTPSTSSYCSGQ